MGSVRVKCFCWLPDSLYRLRKSQRGRVSCTVIAVAGVAEVNGFHSAATRHDTGNFPNTGSRERQLNTRGADYSYRTGHR